MYVLPNSHDQLESHVQLLYKYTIYFYRSHDYIPVTILVELHVSEM